MAQAASVTLDFSAIIKSKRTIKVNNNYELQFITQTKKQKNYQYFTNLNIKLKIFCFSFFILFADLSYWREVYWQKRRKIELN